LTGTASESVSRNGHEAIKTFGVGADKTRTEWGGIIRQLFAADALETASEEHGGFKLSAKGEAILLGQESIQLRKDPPKAPKPARSKGGKGQDAPEGLDEDETRIFTALRRKRLELAREEGVAAYVVFADRTLIELARLRPLSLREMAGIYGVGTAKLERYGEAFLEVLLAG